MAGHGYRDTAQHKRVLEQAYAGGGWIVPELPGRVRAAEDLYFDAVSQVRLDSWSKGRVGLLGDAASSVLGPTSLRWSYSYAFRPVTRRAPLSRRVTPSRVPDEMRPHPALTSRSAAVLTAAVASDARAVAKRALAARIPVRPSSIAIDTKMKLSVSAPTLTCSVTSQVPS